MDELQRKSLSSNRPIGPRAEILMNTKSFGFSVPGRNSTMPGTSMTVSDPNYSSSLNFYFQGKILILECSKMELMRVSRRKVRVKELNSMTET